MLAIVDAGIGNLRSVEKAFAHVGVTAMRTADKARLREATHLVLPGVGAFGDFMATLGRLTLDEVVVDHAEAGLPLLGICVGMQALYEESEEFGRHRGLCLLPGKVVRFPEGELVVPHSGWNLVRPTCPDPLLPDPDPAWFYFVHSYHVWEDDPATRLAVTEYGRTFTAACHSGSCWGAQFHPEKSQGAGLALLERFAKLEVSL